MKRVTLTMYMLQSSSAVKRSFPCSVYVATVIACLFSSVLCAQTSSVSPTPEYQKVINDRVAKIVDVLEITDSKKYTNALETISSQYFALNDIHEKSKEKIARIKKRHRLKNNQRKSKRKKK